MIALAELLKFSLFSSLEPRDLEPLLPHLRERHFRRGQILFMEGEIGSQVYFVLTGQIKLSTTLPTGEEQIVNWFGPYDSFAETLLLESGPYPATAEATVDSQVLILNNERIAGILVENPRIAVSLVRTLNKRLRLSQEYIRILTSRSAAGVVAALLLRLAKPSEIPGEPIFVDATLTNRDLAKMAGTSRECVNRALNNWKRIGILRLQGDRLEILKPQELADWP